MSLYWHQTKALLSKQYTCGYCGNDIASDIGYHQGERIDGSGASKAYLYICHNCFKPTFFNNSGAQTPGIRPGEDIDGIDESTVSALYKEARDTFSINAFTATVLSCRKLLMHVAVSRGAKAGESFIKYVEYLSDQNYIPPGSKEWVDHIREKGNEANHEIVIMSKAEADDLLTFVTMLLKLIYEFPHKMKSKISK